MLSPAFPHPVPTRNGASILDSARRAGGRAGQISPVVIAGLVRLADFVVAIASGALLALLYLDDAQVLTHPLYVSVTLVAGISAVLVADFLGLYAPNTLIPFHRHMPRLMVSWASAFAVAGTLVFFLKAGAELSRVWLAAWLVVGALMLVAERGAVSLVMRRLASSERLMRRAVIYGTGALTDELIRAIALDQGANVRIVGVFDDRSDDRCGNPVTGRLGTLDDLLDVARSLNVDLVIVALPVVAEARLSEVTGRLSELPADIRLPAQATQIRLSPRLYSHVGKVAMIDLCDRPLADWDAVLKWLFDKGIGLAALLALAPVMALVALAVRLDSRGPVLFRQKRYGFNNEMIEVWKFRSMHTDQCDAAADRLVTKGDPRVTRVGRFIRKTSLDELPQLINVLKGDLSLVGPRPHAVAAKADDRLYNDVVARYFARHKVKPGITGWAQISGWRGETDTREKIEKRVEHDLYYIENWSVFFDLYILLMTPVSLVRTQNAY